MISTFSSGKSVLLLIGLFIVSCEFAPRALPEVRTAGKVSDVMRGIDLGAHLRLDTVLTRPGIFGVGALADLRGEITVIDGTPYVTRIINGKPSTRVDSSARASFFVYSQFLSRKTIEVEMYVSGIPELRGKIEHFAESCGFKKGQPFPFSIAGTFDRVEFHVIDGDTSEASHSPEMHEHIKRTFNYFNTEGILQGFYSTGHEGVFTHRGEYVHIHYIDEKRTITGHIDDIVISGFVKLIIPSSCRHSMPGR